MGDVLTIDCGECSLEGTAACGDCVVTFLCGRDAFGMVQFREARAITLERRSTG